MPGNSLSVQVFCHGGIYNLLENYHKLNKMFKFRNILLTFMTKRFKIGLV